MLFSKYPYVNFSDYNLDWIIYRIKKLSDEMTSFINLNTIKYADPIQWDITRQYEANTVVINPFDGTAYISTVAVPYGVNISNEEYWTPIFNYGESLNTLREQIAENNQRDKKTANKNYVDGNLLWYNGALYEVLYDISAGTELIVGVNIEPITIEKLISDVRTDTDKNTADIIEIKKAFVTPEMFGAVGDGITDDTEAVISAINSGYNVTGVNGSVYKITKSIETSSLPVNDMNLRNCNFIVQIPKGYFITVNNNFNKITFDNCWFDGGGVAYGVFADPCNHLNALYVKDGEVKHFNANVIDNFSYTFSFLAAADEVVISGLTLYNNVGHGLIVRSDALDGNENAVINVSDCHAKKCGTGAIAIGIGSYSHNGNRGKATFTNCIAEYNSASGIAPHGLYNVAINNCISNNNGEHGFVIQQSYNSSISGCVAVGNQFFGIRIQGDFSQPERDRFVHGVIVSGCTIDGASGQGGINVGVKATDIVIENNIIENSARPFYTDQSSTGRNVGSRNVIFRNNKFDFLSATPNTFTDFFDEFILIDNTDLSGKPVPDGYYRVNQNNRQVFLNTGDTSENISPYNTLAEQSPFVYDSTHCSYENGNLTILSTFTAASNNNLFSVQFPISGVLTVSVSCPDFALEPMLRLRGAGGLIDTIPVYTPNNANGNLTEYTFTLIDNTAQITTVELMFRLRSGKSITQGTYPIRMSAAAGFKVRRNVL